MQVGGMGATEATMEILRSEGIDVSAHRSQGITKELIRRSDMIIVMERRQEERVLDAAPEVKNRVFLLKEFAKIADDNSDVDDPIGKSIEFYRHTFSIIKEAVERISNVI